MTNNNLENNSVNSGLGNNIPPIVPLDGEDKSLEERDIFSRGDYISGVYRNIAKAQYNPKRNN
jgi:hypothetical protein